MKKKLNSPILAEGKSTGHCHRLVGDISVYETDGGVREFEVENPVDLVHEEHGTINLEKGKYSSDRVLEFDPFENEARKVAD